MTNEAATDTTDEAFPHSGPIVITKLRGPSATRLDLRVAGEQQIQWAPEDRRALEMEVRAKIVSNTAGIPPLVSGSQPLVHWSMEIGHGKYTWKRPTAPQNIGASTLKGQLYTMPTRGLFLRINARELLFKFRCEGDFAVPAVQVASTKIQISFQPVLSSTLPAYPRSQLYLTPGGTFGDCEFPMEATEFRVRTTQGAAFAAGDTFVIFLGLNGGSVGALDAAAAADWVPIPTPAAKYATGLGTIVPPPRAEFAFR